MTLRVYLDPKRLDRRVRIERKTTTKGASGGIVKAWALVDTVWAGIRGVSGRKVDTTSIGGGEVGETTHEIEMRYFDGLAPATHRLRNGSTIYEITSVIDVYDQRVKMIVGARVGVSDG